MKNNSKNLRSLLIFGSLFLFSCGGSGVKKYYETVKESLHSRNNNIQEILKNAEDHEETDMAAGADVNNMPQGVKDAVNNLQAAKSKLYPLKNEDCFILDIESQKGKETLSYFETDPVLHTELFSDDIYRISQKDSIGNERNPDFFKSNVERYLNRKYLVLVDCQYYYYPKQVNSREFQPGYVIKKVSIYDIATKKLADSYYLYASSSDKIRNNAGNPANFSKNLATNITGQLTGSIFQ